MDEIISKGSRLKKIEKVVVQLRPEVYEWLSSVGHSFGGRPSPAYVARALLEDAFDRYSSKDPAEEVSAND